MEDEVVVASYNMSFMSDENTPIEKAQFASEATFLSSNPKISDPVHRRDYWKNALLLLEKFIEEQKHTCVIGLQEMNKTIKGSNTGSDAVDNMLHNLNKKLNTSYKQFCDTITNKGNLIALSIIYDTSRMGNPKENDGKETVIWDNDEYKGRPAMLVVTDKNNVFITIHGAQAPDLGRNKTEFNQVIVAENKNKVEDTVQSILKNFDLGSSEEQQLPNNIFLMGDLNDRYDEIKEFVILNERLHYSGDAPKSCCHNWDSSCSDDRYLKEYSEKYTNDSSNKKKKKGKLVSFDENDEYGTCSDDPFEYPITEKNVVNGKEVKIKLPMNTQDGMTTNYRYRGDKVFGTNPITTIKMYQGKFGKGKSVESDHQLVYATFKFRKDTNQPVDEDLYLGGGRKRRTHKHRITKRRPKHMKKKKGGRKTKKRARKTRRL